MMFGGGAVGGLGAATAGGTSIVERILKHVNMKKVNEHLQLDNFRSEQLKILLKFV